MSNERDWEILDYFQSHILQPGEEILWKGRPSLTRSLAIGTINALGGIGIVGVALHRIALNPSKVRIWRIV